MPKLRALIVEDRAADAELMAFELRRAGFDLEWQRVETEPDYLAQLDTQPDVILCDHNLPQFGAPRALSLLKSRGLDIPIIIVSGAISEEVAVERIKEGATDYLLKDRLARLGPAVVHALEQKKIREERKRADEALRESEQRFRQLAENIREIFFVAGPGGSPIEYISPAYERITGRKCEDLYQNPLAWLEMIHPEDRKRIEKAFRNDPANLNQEGRIRTPSGEVRHLYLRSFPVTAENGEVVRIVGIAEDITERKSAEARMRMQSAALASAANGIVITDREGVITWVNPAFSKLTGYSFEESVGKNPRLLKSDEQSPIFYQNLWKTILAGEVWSGETVNRRKDGSLYTEEQSITPVRDDKGEISHFIAIKQDITERKRAAREAQRNLERIHALREIDRAIGSTLDLKVILDILLEKIELFIPIAAASTVKLFNRPTGDLEALACRGIDETTWKSQHPGIAITAARRVAETRAPLTILNLLQSSFIPDPELVLMWGLVSYLGVPLIAHDRVLGVLNLYTRQEHEFTGEEIEFFNTLAGEAAIAIHNARLYETISRSNSALEISNRNLETSLSQLSGLYTALTPLAPSESIDETLHRIVERLMEVTGSDAALIRLRDKATSSYVITGHRGFSDEYIERVKTTPHGGAVEWVIEHGEPIIAPDIGSEARLRGKLQLKAGLLSCAILPLKVQNEVRGIMHIASRTPGYFDEEQKDHLMAIARQMGIALENKELFERLRGSRDELEKANKIKDDFLNVMSHELKTPLVVIMGYAEMLKNETMGAINERQQNALERVLACANEQLGIINNILGTLHLRASAIAPEYQVVNLTHLMDTLKSEYEVRTGKRNLQLSWSYPAAPVEMMTDLLKLKQILCNLINNAIKFTEKGGVTISAKEVNGGSKIEFRVSDTGIGIPKSMQESIFEKFYQLDSSDTRRYGGVGLGLHIVRQLTEVLRGEIEVESELGKGSTFTVRLPRMNPALAPQAQPRDPSALDERQPIPSP